MTVEEKCRIVANINCKLKSYFRYDAKTDCVIEEFNHQSQPVAWSDWYANYR